MNYQVLVYSRFQANPNKDGGNRRSCQIMSTLASEGYNVKRIDEPKDTMIDFYSHYIEGAKYLLKNKKYIRLFNRKFIGNCGKHLIYFKTILRNLDPEKTIIINESSYGWDLLLFDVASKMNFKIFAIPHNLESLVYKQKDLFSNKKAPNWLLTEIAYLSKASAVLTISREEQWLLRNFGIDAYYYPYYPTQEIESEMLKIRREREASNKEGALFLASFTNPPSKEGLVYFINEYIKNNRETSIYIAGYGLNELKDQLPKHEKLFILGEIDKKDLLLLMTSIKALITLQIPSSGALTKIIEFLIAGIPILADENSSRNYFNLSGITTYSTISSLFDLLKSDLETPNLPVEFKSLSRCFPIEIRKTKSKN